MKIENYPREEAIVGKTWYEAWVLNSQWQVRMLFCAGSTVLWLGVNREIRDLPCFYL